MQFPFYGFSFFFYAVKYSILTDTRIRHYDHHIRISCENIDKRSETRVPYFHTLEMRMKFAARGKKPNKNLILDSTGCKVYFDNVAYLLF